LRGAQIQPFGRHGVIVGYGKNQLVHIGGDGLAPPSTVSVSAFMPIQQPL
jgi:hypothetical protein